MLEFGLPDRRLREQAEGPHLLAQDFRVEQWFGFDSHLPGDKVSGDGGKTKRIEPPTSNIQHRTSNIERPGKATQSHLQAIYLGGGCDPQATPKPP